MKSGLQGSRFGRAAGFFLLSRRARDIHTCECVPIRDKGKEGPLPSPPPAVGHPSDPGTYVLSCCPGGFFFFEMRRLPFVASNSAWSVQAPLLWWRQCKKKKRVRCPGFCLFFFPLLAVGLTGGGWARCPVLGWNADTSPTRPKRLIFFSPKGPKGPGVHSSTHPTAQE